MFLLFVFYFATLVFTFQGNNVWVTNNDKRVQLRDVFLPSLTEVERLVLEKQAQEKILQLGITVSPHGRVLNESDHKIRALTNFITETSQTNQKPHKRRVLLLKRKAVTTGIFDSKGKDDYSKGKL